MLCSGTQLGSIRTSMYYVDVDNEMIRCWCHAILGSLTTELIRAEC